MRRASESFFGRFASRCALRRTPQTYFKTMVATDKRAKIQLLLYTPLKRSVRSYSTKARPMLSKAQKARA
ncbi:hypothetical protein Hanom_Chr17g01542841 [Helianthus anomalus]